MKKIFLLSLTIVLGIFALGQNRLQDGDHFASINGIKMHYFVRGKGPVCLLPTPGFGLSIDYLKSTLHPLENYFKIVYYDTRMSGQSSGPQDTTKYTSKDFMDDTDSLREYLKQEKVWVMGHSSGGFQVLNYGIHHGDHLKGIIVLDGIAGSDSLWQAEYVRRVMQRQELPACKKGADFLLGRDTTRYSFAQVISIIMPLYFHDPANVNEFAKFYVPMSEKAYHFTTAAKFGSEYLFPELRKITVPTLVVVGDDDFTCDKISQADRIARSIPSSYEVVIKDAGHFPWFEQPEQFSAACGKWLKNQGL